MTVLTVKIPDELNSIVEKYCKEEERSKSWLLKKALQEKLEDWKDLRAAKKGRVRYEAGGKVYSLEEIIDEFGIDLTKIKNKKKL